MPELQRVIIERVVIEGVGPEIDCGRFPVKRTVGEPVAVEADAFMGGHEALACRLLWRPESQAEWHETAMAALPGDRWRAAFTPTGEGRWLYTVTGWVDPFETWRRDLKTRLEAGRDVAADLLAGAALVREAGERAAQAGRQGEARVLAGLAEDLETGADPDERLQLALDDELAQLMDVYADRSAAVVHPRELGVVVDRERARFSAWYEMSPCSPRECEARLPDVARMGFDVFCLPLECLPGESPVPELRRLVRKARRHGLEIAVAVEASSDLQDLKGAFDAWIGEGVRIFRVDDPHARPFVSWEWAISEIKREHPDVLFLAGACDRPKIRYRLARLGFTQSHDDLPWSGGRREIEEHFSELARTTAREFYRPSLWPDMPDLLADRPAFVQRLILAATLRASYGLRNPGLDPADTLPELIALVNRIRRDNPALQSDRGLRFHGGDNEQILCYSKTAADNAILVVVVNLDARWAQSAWVELDLGVLGLTADEPFQVHDLLTGARYSWHGSRNFVRLDPNQVPAHVFRVRRRSEKDFEGFSQRGST